MSRRKGRILAFQALYAYEAGGGTLEEVAAFPWVDGSREGGTADADERAFAGLLVSGTVEHLAEIDREIKKYLLPSWDFTRINRVSLAVIRMSTYVLLYQKDIPPSIVIDEAVDIAKEFGVDDSYKFVNGLLDALSKSPEATSTG
ncbi:MAG: transcription antitermination factor NusB [Treponema sp.]|nr:transcription antitermination factor NusB [Treponema sp.]